MPADFSHDVPTFSNYTSCLSPLLGVKALISGKWSNCGRVPKLRMHTARVKVFIPQNITVSLEILSCLIFLRNQEHIS